MGLRRKFLKISLFVGLVILIWIITIVSIGPRFKVSNITLNPSEIEAGQLVEILLTVTNDGNLKGAHTVAVKIDGKIEATREVTLAGGQSKVVSFTLTKDIAGTYTLEVDGQHRILKVLKPATFELSNLTISPTQVEIGTFVEISITVKNKGEVSGTKRIVLTVDGKEVEAKNVTIAGGATESILFSLTKYEAGYYNIGVEELSQILRVNPKEKSLPEIPLYQPHTFETKPEVTAIYGPSYKFSIETSRTHFYDYSRGYVKIWLANKGNNDLFVYQYGSQPEWLSAGMWYPSDTGITIRPNEKKYIGMTSIKVNRDIDSFSVKYGFSLLAKTTDGKWYDYGTVFMDPVTIQVNPVIGETHQEYVTSEYMSKKANDMVDPTDPIVREVAVGIAKKYPGRYNVYQLSALFDFVSENIEYISDPRGADYWAKPSETLALGAGDCEDQAILLVSLIEAIGGTTRLYVTEDHMFAATYIGTENHASAIVDAIGNYYDTSLTLHYLIHEGDVWLLLEPTGGFYAGSLPAGAKPTRTAWDFENVRTITVIDITR